MTKTEFAWSKEFQRYQDESERKKMAMREWFSRREEARTGRCILCFGVGFRMFHYERATTLCARCGGTGCPVAEMESTNDDDG